MRLSTPSWATVTALVIATAIHGAYRLGAARHGRPTVVSALEVGQALPLLDVQILGVEGGFVSRVPMASASCQVVVAFDPSCPHCRSAADREKLQAGLLPTVWITDADSATARLYRPLLRAETRLAWSRLGLEALQVQGVPAAFLVDDRGIVRRVWPYRGEENPDLLRRQCGPSRGSSDR